ncbi:hypothetical protein HK413_05775 [Mucilaginibacter sp. S1162]|uniref:Uncharacterized protein n=1 Tax=Mucilaginibacter humi TaxID=2732510 RepID=A0ABX1W3D7_9SPHI|nr:hypothetical protein [Mucilaginibacter humi]NNU33769.1 hypothetical protein [Mucilaginibacter humi]
MVKSAAAPLLITISPSAVKAAAPLPEDLSAEMPVPWLAGVTVAVARLFNDSKTKKERPEADKRIHIKTSSLN